MRLSDLEAAATRLISGGDRREEPRFAVNIPAQAVITHPNGTSAMLRDVVVEELTPRGAAIICQWPIKKRWHVKVRLMMGATHIELQGLTGRRRTRRSDAGILYIHRIDFIGADAATLEALGFTNLTAADSAMPVTVIGPADRDTRVVRPAAPLPTTLPETPLALTTRNPSPIQTMTIHAPFSASAGAAQLLAVFGGGARIEGRFAIEESIEIQCHVTGELDVGGTLVIGENGEVSADVSTVHAVIRGRYEGNLKASGSVEIAATAQVNGNIETDELTIAKGAVFTGNISHVTVTPAIPEAKTRSIATGTRSTPVVLDAERRIPGSRVPVGEPIDIPNRGQVELS